MERRTVLGRLGMGGLIGLAGCVGSPPSGASTQSTTSTDPQRSVSITEQDSVPEEHEVRIEATVLEPTITDSHTARVRITVTNEGPARGISAATGDCALFDRNGRTSTPRNLWLSLADDPTYATQTGPRWVADPPGDETSVDDGCAVRTYESGESVRTEYDVFHDGRVDGYLDPGIYQFEEEVHVTPDASTESDEGSSVTFTWGFSLNVGNPNCSSCF